jgi:adenylate cyclase
VKDRVAPPIILVVDDDSASGDIVARLLAREGYATRVASSGVEALRILRTEAIDLILLDVMMPGMDGLQVCAALHAEHSRIPIILLTAKDDTNTRAEGMHLGVTEFLTKPINRAELLGRVRAQLHVIDLARQLETVERNLRRPPGRPSSDSDEG